MADHPPLLDYPAVSAPQQNYRPVIYRSCNYKYRTLAPISQVNNLVTNSTTQAQFKIPAGLIVNPARTSFRYRVDMPAEALRTHIQHAQGVSDIQSIQIQLVSGAILMNQQYIKPFQKLALPVVQKSSEWLSENNGGTTSLATDGEVSGWCPIYATGGDWRAGSYGWTQSTGSANVQVASQDYFSPSSFDKFTDGATGTVNYLIPGKAFPHSWLSQDRDFIFNEDCTVSVTFNQSNDQRWTAPTGATGTMGTTAVAANNPTVTNLALDVAYEADEKVANLLRDAWRNGGITTRIPFVNEAGPVTSDTSTSLQVTTPINNFSGRRLLRIYNGLFISGTRENRWARNNYNNQLWSAFNSMKNGERLADIDLTPATLYQQKKQFFKRSVIGSFSNFQDLSVIPEDFCVGNIDGPGLDDHEKDIFGHDLVSSGPISYQVTYTKSAVALIYFCFYITHKLLVMGPQSNLLSESAP